MGLNTIHAKSKDLMTLYNLTQNKYFKAELIQSDSARDYATANGLDFYKIKHVIKINGASFLNLDFKTTMISVMLGVIIAGIIMTTVSVCGLHILGL